MKRIAVFLVVAGLICGCTCPKPLTDEEMASLAGLAKRLSLQVSSGMPLRDLEELLTSKGRMRVWAQTTGYFQFSVRPGLGALAYCAATDNGYILCGRQVEFIIDLSPWDGNPIRARLSETNVLAIADGVAVEKKGRYEGFDLKYYPERLPRIDLEGKKWWILYDRVPNRWPGDHFSITVDDATKETHFFGGI